MAHTNFRHSLANRLADFIALVDAFAEDAHIWLPSKCQVLSRLLPRKKKYTSQATLHFFVRVSRA